MSQNFFAAQLSLEYKKFALVSFLRCTVDQISDTFPASTFAFFICIYSKIWTLSNLIWKLNWTLIDGMGKLLYLGPRRSFCMFTRLLTWNLQNSLLEFLEIFRRVTCYNKVLLVACAEEFRKLWFVRVQIFELLLLSTLLRTYFKEDIFSLNAQ